MCCIRSSLAYLHGLPIEAIVKDTPCNVHSACSVQMLLQSAEVNG